MQAFYMEGLMPEIMKRNKLLRFLLSNLMFYANDDGSGGGAGDPPAPAAVAAPAKPVAAAPNPLLEGPIEDVPDAWREHARELRRENAALRERTKQVDEAAAQAKINDAVKKAVDEQAAKTEGLLKAERDASDKRTIAAEVRLAATKLGIVDLDGLKLADISKLTVNAETGEVTGVDELMTEFKTARPYLFKEPASGSSHPGAAPKPAPEAKFDAAKATPDELKAEAKRRGLTLKDR